MSGHPRNNRLQRSLVPEVIYSQTSLWIVRVPTVLDVPLDAVLFSLPFNVETVVTAVRICYSRFEHEIAQGAIRPIELQRAESVREPQQASSCKFDVLKDRRLDALPSLGA